MGQCYDVNLRIRFKDKDGAKKALQNKIERSEQEHVRYYLPYHDDRKFDTEDLWDLIALFFGGWDGKFCLQNDWERRRDTRVEGQWIWSSFDASYGWEGVMRQAFNELAPYLEDYSEIEIYPDSGCDHGIVVDGDIQWVS